MTIARNDALIKRKFYQYLLPGIMMVLALQARTRALDVPRFYIHSRAQPQ